MGTWDSLVKVVLGDLSRVLSTRYFIRDLDHWNVVSWIESSEDKRNTNQIWEWWFSFCRINLCSLKVLFLILSCIYTRHTERSAVCCLFLGSKSKKHLGVKTPRGPLPMWCLFFFLRHVTYVMFDDCSVPTIYSNNFTIINDFTLTALPPHDSQSV